MFHSTQPCMQPLWNQTKPEKAKYGTKVRAQTDEAPFLMKKMQLQQK